MPATMKRRQQPTKIKVTELGVPPPPPTVVVQSHNQSGGITAHTVNMTPTPAPKATTSSRSGLPTGVPEIGHASRTIVDTAPQPAPKKKAPWLRLAPIAGIVGILSFLGLSFPNWFTSQPQTQMNEKTSVSSENQSGGVTAANVGTVNINTMQPLVEGVRVYTRQVPSPLEHAPYAIEITVQVASPVQPFALAVVCDKEITEGKFSMPGGGAFQNVTIGALTSEPKKSYYVGFNSPPVTPSSPLLVTIMCKEPFNVLRVERL